jgi:hypothetical protein
MLTQEQQNRFNESATISIIRETKEFYGMEMLWSICADNADWIGFQDDFGTFVPVDWG